MGGCTQGVIVTRKTMAIAARRSIFSNHGAASSRRVATDGAALRLEALAFALGVLVLATHVDAASEAPAAIDRQALDDAWWTGPIIAAGAGTLPKGRALIEPYVFDVISDRRYDDNGDRRRTDRVHSFGSLTYMLYGVTDKFTAGLIPVFGFNDLANGTDSSGIGIGDLSVQGQYRLSQFREGSWVPTSSVVVQQVLPTGKYDRLGARPADGLGGGAYTTIVSLYSQYYLWMPNGRITRTRLNVSYALSDSAHLHDVSVYGTREGFRGRAKPGKSFTVFSAWEYSMTSNWVWALDLMYQHDEAARVSGFDVDPASGTRTRVDRNLGSAWRFAVAPAIEYNFNSRIGVLFGVRWFAAGRNTSASVTPVVALNMVY
jgi:hypothetical protein